MQSPPVSRLALGLCAALALGLAACADTAGPKRQLAVADAAVTHADTPGTQTGAPAELQLAIDKLASAHLAMTSHNYARAGQLADQAEVDAELAEVRAQSSRARKAAQESKDAAGALREELNRNAPR
ncbi:DUF4398 domain-containing protein [Derxia lacustris]|uniref:DUF4398 domain-containing protein n=1 Tax=Derxia lacustris TaxID=764842 RepID=UPI00111C8371|nr:DUF4398 domain-containing protein [Derxia lacustris]